MTTLPKTSHLQLTMESLDLPKELYWDGKLEPTSPPSAVASELFALNETTIAYWPYDDNFADGLTIMDNDETCDLKETTTWELLSDEDLVVEFMDLQEEECLLDQKLPHYVDYEPNNNLQTIIDVVSQPLIPLTKVQAAAAELQEHAAAQFETAAVFAQLTPPQSPPQCTGYLHQGVKEEHEPKAVLQQALATVVPTAATSGAQATPYNFNNWAGQQAGIGNSNEIERQVQLVDEIVKIRAQELQFDNEDCESQSSFTASLSSRSSSNGSADEEWLPKSNISSPCHSGSGNEEHMISGPASPVASSTTSSRVSPAASKKRTRAYGRGVEDRKIRKKEQNKNAATRYRQKKKIEMENVLGVEQELAQENESLRRTLKERRKEAHYLRQLIREFYQGRKP